MTSNWPGEEPISNVLGLSVLSCVRLPSYLSRPLMVPPVQLKAFVPVVSDPLVLSAGEVGLKVHPDARVVVIEGFKSQAIPREDVVKVVIEGNWGLGETVVSGSVNPDKFVVDKVVMEVTEKTLSTKHVKCVYDPDAKGVKDVDVEADMQRRWCLKDEEVKELVRIAKNIEAHYGCPMDIEWAVDEDFSFPKNIFIVQARPETVWSQRRKGPLIGSKTGYQLLMEQAMKRMRLQ